MALSDVTGVFLDADTLGADIDLSELKQLACEIWPVTQPEQIVPRAVNADYLITNKVVITEQVMAQLPELKLICVAATGTNNVDLVAAQRRGIAVCNVTDYAGTSIAQLVFSFISELLTHTVHYAQLVKAGQWSASPHFCLFDKPIVELAGKTIGLIGYGALAKSVEKIALAYGMEVLVAGRKGDSQLKPGRTAFTQVLQQSDIISLHCPLTEQTKDLITTSEISQMKPSAILINTARGGVINECDLLQALRDKTIAGAATDVLTQEPPAPDHPMLSASLDNLLITPHIAWATREARKRMLAKVIGNIRQHFVD